MLVLSKAFRAWDGDQTWLQPPSVRQVAPPGRVRPVQTDPTDGRVLERKPRMQAIAETIRRAGLQSRCRLRKQVVEPAFEHNKQARGVRQFPLRGLDKVRGEWAMACTVHNLLKLHRAAA